MKLTLKLKLLPTGGQAVLLLKTMEEANTVCNSISKVAWDNRIFNTYKLHHEVYHPHKSTFKLSSQILVRCIAKVADAYKLDKKVKREFKSLGGISYDSRVMTYKPNDVISLWAIGGRINIPFVCHARDYFPYIKGEADLVYKKGKFYLFQTVDVPNEEIIDSDSFIGCDFGLTTIVATSDGVNHSAEWLNNYREYRQKVRSSINAKADTSKRSTKRNCRKVLKRLKGKERATANLVNHTISKSIVESAKNQGLGISIEDLTNIRFTSKRRNKKFRTKMGNWNFADLRAKIEYKSLLRGVKFVVVNPAYSSQTCHCCKHIGKRTNKVFKCTNTICKVDSVDADFNASKVISLLGSVVNQSEKSNDMCCSIAHLYSGLKSS